MIKFENTVVSGWEAAIRGCRNPMNSWHLSDSYYRGEGVDEYCSQYADCDDCPLHDDMQACDSHTVNEFYIGPKDMDMMTRLIKAGTDEAKFMRYIDVTVDITAPLYWWKEFDTYKVGTVANSCSTMHKIHDKEFTLEDFSTEYLDYEDKDLHCCISGTDAFNSYCILLLAVKTLNWYRHKFLETKDKKYWWQMIQLLPSSYNQRRTIKLNYQVLRAMYFARRNHKLDEWCEGFCEWVESLPYSELITMNGKYEDLVEKYAALKADFDALRVEYNAVLQENISLKDLYNNTNEECDRLRDELAEVRNENTNLKNHLSEMYDECILKGAEKEFGYVD